MDKKTEFKAFSEWSFKKEGEPIGRMDGNDAAWAGWEARALLSASIADTAGAKPVTGPWPTDAMNAAGMRELAAFHKSRGDTVDAIYLAMSAAAPAPSVALCSICNGYGRWQDGHSGTESDGYAPNIVECECTDEERRPECRQTAPSVADAAGASERIKSLFIANPPDELGPSDEPESQYRLGYNTALEDAIDALAKEKQHG